MYVWLNLKTIKFYLIKLPTDFWWQTSYLVGRKSLIGKTGETIQNDITDKTIQTLKPGKTDKKLVKTDKKLVKTGKNW